VPDKGPVRFSEGRHQCEDQAETGLMLPSQTMSGFLGTDRS
jgi:hypothetical protein